jgi:hypothetical protein
MTLNEAAAILLADAEAGETVYVAVLRDPESWQVVTNCPHRHRTRTAAQRCADGWLRKAITQPDADGWRAYAAESVQP